MPNGNETILIVEDAEDVRTLARRTLEERGYTVRVARNAAEALEIAAAGNIDVLLTDIVMPQTSGPELVAQYLATWPAPLVIYMSGYADDALARYELDPGAVFLRKPFTPATLARTVRRALDAWRVDSRVRAMRRTSGVVRAFARAILGVSRGRAAPAAQVPILLEGVADGEFWSTTAYSNLLTRNAGRASGPGARAAVGRDRAVAGARVLRTGRRRGRTGANGDRFLGRLRGSVRRAVRRVARARARRGKAAADRRHLRVAPILESQSAHRRAGRLLARVSARRSSSRARAIASTIVPALVSLPPSHEGYVPTPARAAASRGRRRVLADGRAAHRRFVHRRVVSEPQLHRRRSCATRAWSSYTQRVFALDAAFSRGYLETHVEAARGIVRRAGARRARSWATRTTARRSTR